MENGNDPDFNNIHGEALFEYYVRIEGEAVTRSVTQRELAEGRTATKVTRLNTAYGA